MRKVKIKHKDGDLTGITMITYSIFKWKGTKNFGK